MFKFNGGNRKKAINKSKSQQMDNKKEKTVYEENFNEIILNDLVPEEKRGEFGLESVETNSTPKKAPKVNFNLGLNKKKKNTSTSKDSEPEKNTKASKGKKQTKNETVEQKPKGKKGSKVKDDVENNKVAKNKKGSKKKERPSKTKLNEHEEIKIDEKDNSYLDVEEVQKEVASKNTKTKKKRVRPSKKDSTAQVKESKPNLDEDASIYSFESEDDNKDNIISFRSDEVLEEDIVEEEELIEDNSKLENLVWSEDKFPKK